MKIQEMGVLPLLPTLLNPQSSCTPKVANIIAEVAKNGEVRFPSPSTQDNPDFLCSHSSVLLFYTFFLSHPFCFTCFLHKYIIQWDSTATLLMTNVSALFFELRYLNSDIFEWQAMSEQGWL